MTVCNFIAGLFAGMAGLLVGHPIDTVKVNQQVHSAGFRQTIGLIFRNHGWRALGLGYWELTTGYYSGMGMPLVTSGAMQSIYFGVYGTTLDALIQRRKNKQEEIQLSEDKREKGLMQPKKKAAYGKTTDQLKEEETITPTYLDSFIAGTLAGFCRLFASCPVEVVKTRLQSQKKKIIYKGPIDCVRQVVASKGIRGMFVGGTPLCGRAYGLGVYAVLYEYFKVNIPISNTNVRMFISGGTAGLLQWWMVIPLDVLKSRMQADSLINPKYNGVIDCVKKMYLTEGWKSFFRGFVPLSLRAFPVNGATFLAYETVVTLCKKYEKPEATLGTLQNDDGKDDHKHDIKKKKKRHHIDKYGKCAHKAVQW